MIEHVEPCRERPRWHLLIAVAEVYHCAAAPDRLPWNPIGAAARPGAFCQLVRCQPLLVPLPVQLLDALDPSTAIGGCSVCTSHIAAPCLWSGGAAGARPGIIRVTPLALSVRLAAGVLPALGVTAGGSLGNLGVLGILGVLGVLPLVVGGDAGAHLSGVRGWRQPLQPRLVKSALELLRGF